MSRWHPDAGWAKTTALGLTVLCVFSSSASAIRNGTPELGLQYNGVGMFLPTPSRPRGTGAMVSQFVVLTAAQNFPDIGQDPAPVYEFTLGPGLTAHATEVRRHPEFETVDGINLAYDVALVALDRDEVRNWPGINRSAIREVQTPVGALATGVGFGETQTGMGSGVRRSGSFSVSGYFDGADAFGSPIPNAFIEVVPGNELNQCFCNGDQGGPLFFDDRIAGVASFRFVATCEEEGPGYYVSLHRLTDWIRDNLNEMDPPIPGDYNGNGTVDTADYVVWRKTDGTQQGYDAWRTHFGQTFGGGAGASMNATVPEPATLAMLIMAAGWCRLRRRVA
ncbi:MAG: trypsin-like serine protease [Pirellulales bacterium]